MHYVLVEVEKSTSIDCLKHKPTQSNEKIAYVLPTEEDWNLNEGDWNLSEAEIETLSKEALGNEGAIGYLANATILNVIGLIKEFNERGPGFTSFKMGDISCLMFYDPIRPIELDELNEIGKKLTIENTKHYPAKIKAYLEPND